MKHALLMMALSVSSLALADGTPNWRHARLAAQDGTQIAIDFQVEHFGNGGSATAGLTATNVWINATLREVGSDCVLQGPVWIELYNLTADGQWAETPQKVRLQQIDGEFCHYTAQLAEIRIDSFSEGRHLEVHQVLKVSKRGTPLIDPVSGSEDFQLNLNRVPFAN
jgi:hypothetical protein